jgi:hypothetical protein
MGKVVSRFSIEKAGQVVTIFAISLPKSPINSSCGLSDT